MPLRFFVTQNEPVPSFSLSRTKQQQSACVTLPSQFGGPVTQNLANSPLFVKQNRRQQSICVTLPLQFGVLLRRIWLFPAFWIKQNRAAARHMRTLPCVRDPVTQNFAIPCFSLSRTKRQQSICVTPLPGPAKPCSYSFQLNKPSLLQPNRSFPLPRFGKRTSPPCSGYNLIKVTRS